MARPINSDSIRTGRNAEYTALDDRKYVRCQRCGFIAHLDRDTSSSDGSRIGWGTQQVSTALNGDVAIGDSTVTVLSTQGFPDSGSFYIYDTADNDPVTSSINFDGKVNGIRIPADPTINAWSGANSNSPFSYALWVFLRGGGEGGLGAMLYKDQSSSTLDPSAGYKLHIFSVGSGFGQIGANLRHGDGTDPDRLTCATLEHVMPMNEWVRVGFVYNSAGDKSGQIYINGCYACLTTASGSNGSSIPVGAYLDDDSAIPLYLGNRWKGDSTSDGYIGGFTFWKGKALSQSEMYFDYLGQSVSGVTANFAFTEGFGSIVTDAVGGNVGVHNVITSSASMTQTTAVWGESSKNKFRNIVIDDCDTNPVAWVDGSGGDVTISRETTVVAFGAAVVKGAVASGASLETLAYRDFTSTINISNSTAIVFWFRSSVALAAGDFHFIIDDTAACVSPIEDLRIPAITANTWTRVSLNFNYPSRLTAVKSIGIKQTVDKGALNFYIDQVAVRVNYSGVKTSPERVDYTGTSGTSFTGCTGISAPHSTGQTVRGEQLVKGGCPQCGTYRYNK